MYFIASALEAFSASSAALIACSAGAFALEHAPSATANTTATATERILFKTFIPVTLLLPFPAWHSPGLEPSLGGLGSPMHRDTPCRKTATIWGRLPLYSRGGDESSFSPMDAFQDTTVRESGNSVCRAGRPVAPGTGEKTPRSVP